MEFLIYVISFKRPVVNLQCLELSDSRFMVLQFSHQPTTWHKNIPDKGIQNNSLITSSDIQVLI